MRHMRNTLRLALLLGAVALLAACSSIPLKEREQAERARIEAYAGQPVDHFTWLGRYHGWKPVSRDEALVWTTPGKAYLIKVLQPCEDLRFATRIGLTSTLNTVYSRRLDYVKVRGWRCPIERIRPVDYGRLQADLRAERQDRQAVTLPMARDAALRASVPANPTPTAIPSGKLCSVIAMTNRLRLDGQVRHR